MPTREGISIWQDVSKEKRERVAAAAAEHNNTSFMLTNSISVHRLVFVLYFIYDNAQAWGEVAFISHATYVA